MLDTNHFALMPELQTKRCYLCGESKPLTEFNKRNTNSDGLDNRCRPCVNAYQRNFHARRNPPAEKEVLPVGFKRCSHSKKILKLEESGLL